MFLPISFLKTNFLHLRFIDDIFFVQIGSKKDLGSFLYKLNTKHPSIKLKYERYYCVKSIDTEFFWSVFSCYSVNLCIQSKCGKIQTRKTPHLDNLYAAYWKKKNRYYKPKYTLRIANYILKYLESNRPPNLSKH